MSESVWTLFDALHLLARVHTRDDAEIGFTVEMSPAPMFYRDIEYIEAWRIVREQLHLQVEPVEE